jgi:selenocysteine lyase/cysteine desulfurase
MTLSNPKQYYSRFLKGHEGKLHFAAHSHHFWPDVSRDGHMAYWDDCAAHSDDKWSKIFSETIPKTQKHIAKILNLKDHEQIVLAPNTHELSTRLLSLFLGKKDLKILTTTNEFHSWRRQFLRLSEIPEIKIEQVDSTQFPIDRTAFLNQMKSELSKNYDVVFLSQVFFDSGTALTDEEIKSLVDATPTTTLFVLDGYHGFAAIPCDLSKLEGRIFYLGGGYKYAQGGEGIGFMVVPKGNWRPAYTGWYADQAHLSKTQSSQIAYADNGMAFMGATQDPSGFYRFNAVWDLFETLNIDVQGIHQYVLGLQKVFLKNLPKTLIQIWSLKPLFDQNLPWHGHFLTFEASSVEAAEKFQQTLILNHIIIDRRGTRLRFGFGLYQNEADVIELSSRLNKLASKTT